MRLLSYLCFISVACVMSVGCKGPTQSSDEEPVEPVAADVTDAGSTEVVDQKKSMDEEAPAAGMKRMDTLTLPDGEVSLVVLEHGSFVLEDKDFKIYVDPVSSALAYDGTQAEVEKPRMILLTDIHGDHMDVEAVKSLTTDKTVIVAPQAVVDKAEGALDAAIVMANGDEKSVFDDTVKLLATPMYNLKRTPEGSDTPFHVKGRGNGYILSLYGGKVYISGDTECTPEMKALTDIDVAFLTMNLPYTMPVEEAAECIREFKPGVLYPFHYRGQDPSKLEALLADVSDVNVKLLEWYPEAK